MSIDHLNTYIVKGKILVEKEIEKKILSLSKKDAIKEFHKRYKTLPYSCEDEQVVGICWWCGSGILYSDDYIKRGSELYCSGCFSKSEEGHYYYDDEGNCYWSNFGRGEFEEE